MRDVGIGGIPFADASGVTVPDTSIGHIKS
jgi:hypothetical protein